YESEIFERPFVRSLPLLKTSSLLRLETNGYYDLTEWAVAQGTTANALWELNPWINISRTNQGRYSKINHFLIPPGKYEVLVPLGVTPDYEKLAQVEKKFLVKNNSPYIIGDSTKHVVQKGETLSHIAKKYGIKVDDIKRWNGLKSDTIIAGKTLNLQASKTTTPTGNTSKKYKVVAGDTLSLISAKLGVSTKHLMTKNGLKSDVIRPGQVLEY
ncbi:MAG: LysM peptidoglycan-binding domain-containing protein, partial [Candidatus Cloacimonetes bacterium]|nr:LysM peptidoglycan-binding domain-containing protein [Candidatus Cloacimonadota bacterium]